MSSSPSIRDQSEFYDKWNCAYRAGDFDDISPEIRNRGRWILEYLHSRKLEPESTRILEIGCGTGWFTQRLEDLGQVTAIDLSPDAVEMGRQRGGSATYIAGDFFDHDFGEKPFDVVICVETLFYVEDQTGFVAKMRKLLKPGGYACVSTINRYVYERSSDVEAPEAGQLRNWLSIDETRSLLSREFSVERVRTVEPRGDQGILRFVNSYKLNSLLASLLTEARVKRMKEALGFGGGVVFIGRPR